MKSQGHDEEWISTLDGYATNALTRFEFGGIDQFHATSVGSIHIAAD